MLQTQPHFDHVRKLNRTDADDVALLKGIDIVAILSMARRHIKVTAICVGACLALFLVIGFLSTVRYTAQASLLIGNRQIRAIQDISAQTNIATESSLVDNQSELVRSERVLGVVIAKLDLMKDQEFNGTEPPSLPTMIIRFISNLNPLRLFQPSTPGSDPRYRTERIVIANLGAAIKVTRAGKSNVLQIAVTTQQPRKSAAIANGVAEAFLANQVDAHVDEAKRAGDWFRERLEQLRRQSGDASRAVEDYRSRNNLLAANGQLVSDQQLTQLNNDIALAAADLVRKQARYENLKRLIDSGNPDANITEAQEVATIAQLRQKLTDTTKRYSDTVARVGPNHQLSIRLRNDIADYKKQTFEELRNVLAGFESELAIARERQDALTRQLVQSTAVTTSANSSLVQLRQLEQEATAIRALYQSFLQRYQETVQQESFPLNDARVVSDASAPLQASEPRIVLFAAAGILLGLGAGVGIGAFRELSDRAFRTANQVETDLGIDVFGLLPKIDGPSKTGTTGAGLRDYTTPSEGALGQYATKHPFSSYSETLRAVKMGIDGSLKIDRAKVVGIVSSMPREGKSTVSLNLASLLALQGNRVALIDADLREAGLTKLAGLKPTVGLGDVLLEQAPISQIMALDPATGLMIFPATVKHNFFLSGDLISSPNMVALLRSLSNVYDYVIVDLPPIGPVIDARVAAELLDAVVMVVEWGNVPRRFVRNALASSPAVREKLIGAVLNKVEVDKLKSYEPYGLDKKQEEVFNRYYR